LDWLLLTKRPENFFMQLRLAELFLVNGPREKTDPRCAVADWISKWRHALPKNKADNDVPPSNVWIGVSVEDRKRKSRLDLLRPIPAAVHFVSFEPLLEDLELTDEDLEGIDWTIWGGESGKDRRDCGVEALCKGAHKCVERGIPTFFKQDCALRPGQQGRIPGPIWHLKEFPVTTNLAHK